MTAAHLNTITLPSKLCTALGWQLWLIIAPVGYKPTPAGPQIPISAHPGEAASQLDCMCLCSPASLQAWHARRQHKPGQSLTQRLQLGVADGVVVAGKCCQQLSNVPSGHADFSSCLAIHVQPAGQTGMFWRRADGTAAIIRSGMTAGAMVQPGATLLLSSFHTLLSAHLVSAAICAKLVFLSALSWSQWCSRCCTSVKLPPVRVPLLSGGGAAAAAAAACIPFCTGLHSCMLHLDYDSIVQIWHSQWQRRPAHMLSLASPALTLRNATGHAQRGARSVAARVVPCVPAPCTLACGLAMPLSALSGWSTCQ